MLEKLNLASVSEFLSVVHGSTALATPWSCQNASSQAHPRAAEAETEAGLRSGWVLYDPPGNSENTPV